MKILQQTDAINKNNCKVCLAEIEEKHLLICKVVCTGKSNKNNWEQLYPSVYGGYAMLLEKSLIDLPGKHFLVQQINEHSRGGHCEYERQLMDLQGTVLQKFSSRYNSKIIGDDKYLWFLQSGDKPFRFGNDRDLNLIKLNHKTGKIKQTSKLNYPQLLNCSYHYVISVDITEKHNRFNLLIKYSDSEKNTRSKRIDLLEI